MTIYHHLLICLPPLIWRLLPLSQWTSDRCETGDGLSDMRNSTLTKVNNFGGVGATPGSSWLVFLQSHISDQSRLHRTPRSHQCLIDEQFQQSRVIMFMRRRCHSTSWWDFGNPGIIDHISWPLRVKQSKTSVVDHDVCWPWRITTVYISSLSSKFIYFKLINVKITIRWVQ